MVTLNGSASTDNLAVVNHTWSFSYSSSMVMLYETAPTFDFNIPGDYAITLNVSDATGNWDTDTMHVYVMISTLLLLPVTIGPSMKVD